MKLHLTHLVLAFLSLARPAAASAQDSTRVAELTFGGSRVVLEAHSEGDVSITSQSNRLTGSTVQSLADLRSWLDSAYVVLSKRDSVRHGFLLHTMVQTPGGALLLLRTEDEHSDRYLLSVGQFVKATVTLQLKQVHQLMESLATAVRQADRLTLHRLVGAAQSSALPECRLSVTVSAEKPITPSDSGAIFLDRVRGELENRLSTYIGLPTDVGLGVWFNVRSDGAGWNAKPDDAGAAAGGAVAPASAKALADLRTVVLQAGTSYRFTGLPRPYEQIRVHAVLQPQCPVAPSPPPKLPAADKLTA